ncbi:MAG: MBOAT family O-acyltransferase [Rhodospirillales bacterium]|nr:MBOAT family O-acyltransferase [Rhodospirillales bacterium]
MNSLINLSPVAPNSIGYLLITTALVLIAWSSWRRHFAWALIVTGGAMSLTWLRPIDLAAMVLFLCGPYFAAVSRWGRKDEASGGALFLILAWQLALFLVFKRYAWADLTGWLDHPVSLIGISFILFRQIHLVLDAPYIKGGRLKVSEYLAYLLSPWTLIAGPIQLYESFAKGLAEIGRPTNRELLSDAHRIANGLIKAFVIAPLFLPMSDIGLLAKSGADWIDFLIVLYAYPLYLYLNFSGYMDVIIGAARACGFRTLPENFNHPYLARNVQDFWGRWHMSFGEWIRRYVFTPLSAALVKRTAPGWHGAMMALSVLVTFYTVGAWHGTSLNFVVFGMLHGLGLLVSVFFGQLLKRGMGADSYRTFSANPVIHLASVLISLHFVALSFLFLENSVGDLYRSLHGFFLSG